MRRGRPVYSDVRQNMVEILSEMGSAYGYQLAKVYQDIFGKVSTRLFYYHLQKGIELGIFRVHSVTKEEGNYSWGSVAEKTYYTLTDQATPLGDKRVKDYFKKR